jgi:hypothetical protein
MYIYRLYCRKNNRSYVGRTSEPNRRALSHYRALQLGIHRSIAMQHDYNLYGRDAFSFVVLETVGNLAGVAERESYWATRFACFQNGYNSYRPILDAVTRSKCGTADIARIRPGEATAFSSFVRARREQLGFTQRTIANALGFRSAEHIGLVETAQRALDLDKVPQLARVLKCNVMDLAQLALSEQYPLLYRTLFGNAVPKRPRV